MFKYIRLLVLAAMISSPAYATDKTILDLPEETSPATADVLELQKAAGGAGSSKRVTRANLLGVPYERHVQVPIVINEGQVGPPTAKNIGTAGCLSFANTATPDEVAFIQYEVPSDWNGGNLTLELDTILEAAISTGETITFTITYRAVAEGEVITTGTVETISATYTSASGDAQYSWPHLAATVPQTGTNQTIEAQDHIMFQVNRDEADTYTGAGCTTEAEIMYTSTGYPTSN